MEKAMKRAALGRGLGALIPGGSAAERRGVMTLGIEEIEPDRAQPRRHFDETHILELAESIRAKTFEDGRAAQRAYAELHKMLDKRFANANNAIGALKLAP